MVASVTIHSYSPKYSSRFSFDVVYFHSLHRVGPDIRPALTRLVIALLYPIISDLFIDRFILSYVY